jgi:hypothetical protein
MKNVLTRLRAHENRPYVLPLLAVALSIPQMSTAQSSTGPVLHYASAKAGPNQGWEGSTTRGASISIWASNVGSVRGSSFVQVGSVALTSDSDYAEWGATTNPTTAKGYQRITFWLRSNMPAGDTSGVSVTVNGVRSNVLPFTITNTGRIYFLSLTGSQSNNGLFSNTIGSGAGPWSNLGVAVTRMRAGDFLYMRGGNWTAINQNGSSNYSYIGYFESGSGGCVYYQPLINGTDAMRITLTSYPGEVAAFEGSDIRNYSKYWTFTNLRFSNVGANQNLTLGSQWSHCTECSDHSVGLDVIGNEFVGTEHHSIQAFGDNFRIAANYFNVVPVGGGGYGPETAYPLYLSSGIDRVIADNEIHGGAMYSIHAYDEDRESCTDTGRVLQNWIIEGNLMDASDAGAGFRSPMLIGAGNLASLDGMIVRNNILYSNGTAYLAGIRIFAGVERNIAILNNTFYGLPSGVLIDYTSRDVMSGFTVNNNIFANMTTSAQVPSISGYHIYNSTGRPSVVTARSNLYDVSPRMLSATDASPVVGNPLFANPSVRDFHLRSGSPAIDAGQSSNTVLDDYDGASRPQGSGNDIGAFEYLSGTLQQPVSISISPQQASLSPGQTQQFTAIVSGSANSSVSWSISPAVGAISSSGLYTAPNSVSTQQTLVITATSVADPTKEISATVILNPPTPAPVVAVSVSPTSASLNAGESVQFAASVSGSSNVAVIWSMTPVAGTLSSGGLYTAPANVTSQQNISVTVTSVADSMKSATAIVQLNPLTAPIVSVLVTPPSANVTAGQTVQLSAAISGTSDTRVGWTLSPAAGTISPGGLYTAPSTIVSQQTVIVTATSIADPSKYATSQITLNPPPAATPFSLTWTPISATQTRVDWTAPSGRPTGDWLSLTGYGSPDWWYSWSASTRGATSGSFVVNTPVTTGIWHFRYHAAGRYDVLATSPDMPVNIGQFNLSAAPAANSTQLTVAWAAPAGRPTGYSDIVGVYAVGTSNSQALTYQYTKGATTGSFTLSVPAGGAYEVRYTMGYLIGAYARLTMQ